MTVKTILATLKEIESANRVYGENPLTIVEMFKDGDQFMNLGGRGLNFPEITFNGPLFVIKSYRKREYLNLFILIEPQDKIIQRCGLLDPTRLNELYLASPLNQLPYLTHYNNPIRFIIPSTIPDEVETYEQLVLHQTLLSTF